MTTESKPFRRVCDVTERDRRNQRRIIVWSFVWIAAWLAVSLALSRDLLAPGTPAIALTLLTLLPGLGTILAYRRFLREADELLRKIEMEALALAFGVGIVGGFTYFLLEQAGAVAEKDLLIIPLLMIATQAVAVFIGRRRYA
jgi:hypothetical protein